MTSALGKIGLAGLGIAALSGAVQGLVSDAVDAQKVQAQLNAVLTSTHGVSGMTADSINALADSFSKITPFEDEAIGSAENMLLTFTNIGRGVFPQATEAVLNMSQALGQDLQSSAIQLGKALNDPVAGVTALQRVGVKLTDTQKELVAKLVESGNIMGAQKVILGELQTEFGGAAKAAGETFAGKLSILNTQIGNVKEAIGGPLIDVIGGLVSAVTPAITTLATDLPAALQTVSDFINSTFGPYIQAGVELASEAFTALSGVVSSAMGSVLSVVESVAHAVYDALSWLNPFATHSPSLVSQVQDGVALIKNSYGQVTTIATPLETAGASIRDFAGKSKDALKEMVSASKVSLDDLKTALSGAQDALRGFTSAPIEGQGALDDQKFALQQQKNQIQLQITQLKMAGAVNHDITESNGKGKSTVTQAANPELVALEKSLSDLGLKSEALDLQGKLKFDPLERQIKKMTTTAKELSFDQIVKGIQASQASIAQLTPMVAASEAALKLQQKAMSAAGGAAKGAGGALHGMASPATNVGATIGKVNDVMKGFSDQAAIVRQRTDAIKTSVQDLVAPIGQLAASFQNGTTVDLLRQWGQAFADWAVPLYDNLKARLDKFVAGIVGWITAEASMFPSRFREWERAFVEWATPIYDDLKIKLDKFVDSTRAWIISEASLFPAQFREWGRAFSEWVGPAVDLLLAQLGAAGDLIIGWIGAEIGPITDRLVEWGLAFRAWVGPAADALQVELDKIGAAVLAWIGQQLPRLTAQLAVWGEQFRGWVEPVSGALSVLVGILTAVATAYALATAATTAASIVATAHTLVLGAQAIATNIATAAQLAFNLMMAANPIGLVIVVVAGLVAAIVTLYETNSTAREVIDTAFAGIKATIDTVVTFITDRMNEFIRTIDSVSGKINGLLADIKGIPSSISLPSVPNIGGIFTPPAAPSTVPPSPSYGSSPSSNNVTNNSTNAPTVNVNIYGDNANPVAVGNQSKQGVLAANRALGYS